MHGDGMQGAGCACIEAARQWGCASAHTRPAARIAGARRFIPAGSTSDSWEDSVFISSPRTPIRGPSPALSTCLSGANEALPRASILYRPAVRASTFRDGPRIGVRGDPRFREGRRWVRPRNRFRSKTAGITGPARPGAASICSSCIRVAIVARDGCKRRASLDEGRDIQLEPGFVRAAAVAYAVHVLRGAQVAAAEDAASDLGRQAIEIARRERLAGEA